MAHLFLSLLGPIQAALDGEPIVNFESDKVRALLAYLVLESDRSHRRETLAGLLWPERPEQNARRNLNQVLYNLRCALGDHDAPSPFLLVTRQTVQFNPVSDHTLDAAVFCSLLANSQAHQHRRLAACDPCLTNLDRAVALYRGRFLDGFSLADSPAFEEWLLFQRERFHRLALEVLSDLADAYEQRGEYETAIRYTRRGLALDPWREEAHRQLMRALALNGQRSGALTQYETCRGVLAHELGVEPEEKTTILYERIRDGELESLVPYPAFPSEIAVNPLPCLEKEPVAAPSPVFVARERELAQLERRLDSALAGRSQVVFVTGDAGQGKTALMREFARRATEAHPDLLVVGGNCKAHSGIGDPHLPFCEMLGLLTGDVETHWAAGAISREQAQRLWTALPLALQTLVDHGPALIDTLLSSRALMSRLAAAAPHRRAWLAQLEAAIRREASRRGSLEQCALFEQFACVLHSLAEARPLVLLLDDAQWADASSAGLLFHLGRSLKGSRILIACAYRPEEVALDRGGETHPLQSVLDEFKRRFGDIWVNLAQTDEAEGRRFVDAFLDTEPNQLEEDFRRALFRRTVGHPLFTVELLRAMQERGDLIRDEQGCWEQGPALDWETLPARVEGVIQTRVGRLGEELRGLLSAASVEGETFTAQVVARVQEMGERQTLEKLCQLEKRHRLVHEQGWVSVGSRRLTRYRFAHALFQQYLYKDLSEGERTLLHREMAEGLEEAYAGHEEEMAAMVGQLGLHYAQAGERAKAAELLTRAGDQALRAYAHAEARLHYGRVLEALAGLPDTEEIRRRRVDGIIKLTRAAWRSDSPEENLARLAEAEQLVEELPGPDGTPGSDRFRQAWIHYWMGLVHHSQGAWGKAIGHYQQVLPVAQESDDPEMLAIPSSTIGQALAMQGYQNEAASLLEQATPALERTGNWLGWVRAKMYYGAALLLSGDPAAGFAEHQRALARAQEMNMLSEIALHANGTTQCCLFIGDLPRAIESSHQAVELARQSGDRIYAYIAHGMRSWAEARAGQFEAAATSMAQSQAVAQKMGGALMLADWFTIANAEIALGKGCVEEALSLAEQAVGIARKIGSIWSEGMARRVWGQVLAALVPPQWDETEAQLAESLQLLESGHNRLEAARTHMAWGTVCRDRGDLAGAREHWAKAAAQWEASGLAHELEPTRVLLGSLTPEE